MFACNKSVTFIQTFIPVYLHFKTTKTSIKSNKRSKTLKNIMKDANYKQTDMSETHTQTNEKYT